MTTSITVSAAALISTSRAAVKAASTYRQTAGMSKDALAQLASDLNAGIGQNGGIIDTTEQAAIAKILADDSLSSAAAQNAKKSAAPAANKLLSGVNAAVAALKKDGIEVPFKLTWSTAGDTTFKVVAVKATTADKGARFTCTDKTSADTITPDKFDGFPAELLAAIVLAAQAAIDGGLKK